MPNHIQNRLHIAGEETAAIVFDFIKGEKTLFDFNKVLPMPESLGLDSYSSVEDSVKRSLRMPLHEHSLVAMLEAGSVENSKSPLGFDNKEWDMYIQTLQNVRLYGFMNWYQWSIKNWGTKWNAYQTEDKRNSSTEIFFQTAWNCPLPVIKKLSEEFTDALIGIDYADEDSGSNCGKILYKAGKEVYCEQPESQSKEAYEIYFELNPEDKGRFILVGDKYEYVEED